MNHDGDRHFSRRYQTASGGPEERTFSFFPFILTFLRTGLYGKCVLGFLLMLCVIRPVSAAGKGSVSFHNATSFKIPFAIGSADKKRIKSIELYVSEDRGETWKLYTSTTASTSYFAFRGNREGEFWFAIRTLDIAGRYNPSDDQPIEPDWQVVVDTQKPSLALEVIARQGPMAAVRWDARDENLNVSSLKIEYSQPGTGIWRPVPIDRLAPSGETQWDAGSANALRLRASIEDKAGNIQNFETDLPDGVAQRPQFSGGRPESMDSQAPAPIAHMASAGDRRGILGMQNPREMPSRPVQGDWVDNPGSQASPATESSRMSQVYQGQPGVNAPSRPSDAMGQEAVASHVNLINSPKFPLNYSVDDAGPNGPASVELWITRDGGKNWSRWAEDTDRTSPFPVDLGGEGFYGLSIVARSLAGQGDEIPRAGSQAQIWVEVDSTPPAIVLNTIKLGVGNQSGRVLIPWRAEDRNFASRPISLFYRPETSNQWIPIAENIENSGQYFWTPGPQVPPVFHIRIEAIDKAGNKSGVDTTSYEPVLFDRSRPRAKIIGLNINPFVSVRSDNTVPAYRSEEKPHAVVSETLPHQPVVNNLQSGTGQNLKPEVKEPPADSTKPTDVAPSVESEVKLPTVSPPAVENPQKTEDQAKISTEVNIKKDSQPLSSNTNVSIEKQTENPQKAQSEPKATSRTDDSVAESDRKNTKSTESVVINIDEIKKESNLSVLSKEKGLVDESKMNVSAELPPLAEIPMVEPIREPPPALGVE
ncbi:MAG: hypothetical protein ACKO0V_03480 [bacterium]